MKIEKIEIKKLIDEFIIGLLRCNISSDNIRKAEAILGDFYNTKIKNYGE